MIRVKRSIQHRIGGGPGHSKEISISAQAAKERAIKTGYLTKVGFGVKTWKKRFFVHDGTMLLYFLNDTSERQKGEILLDNIVAIEKDEERKHGIAVHTAKRIYYFVGADEKDIEDWKALLSGDINDAIMQVEKVHKSINTELLGTNDSNLENHVKAMEGLLEEFGSLLYSCPRGTICADNAKDVLSKATSSLQHRRRVIYSPTSSYVSDHGSLTGWSATSSGISSPMSAMSSSEMSSGVTFSTCHTPHPLNSYGGSHLN